LPVERTADDLRSLDIAVKLRAASGDARLLTGMYSNDSLAQYMPEASQHVISHALSFGLPEQLHPSIREKIAQLLSIGLVNEAVEKAARTFLRWLE
jgi:hypothetical protein